MTEQLKYSVGIDLGDGQSSIAFVLLEGLDKPEIFELENGERSMITAYATTKGETLIGDKAILAEGGLENALNFKEKPTLDPKGWKTNGNKLMHFAEEFYQMFAEAHPKVDEKAAVYIGHPSSWSTTDVELYEKLFKKADIPKKADTPRVQIKPESRAAFIWVKDLKVDRSGVGFLERLDAPLLYSPALLWQLGRQIHSKTSALKDKLDSVLVVDIGSSTTDFTIVEKLKPKEILVGDQFGARLIDCLIYSQVKEQCPQSTELKERLEMNDRNEVFLLYLCRKAKEQYFANEPIPFVPESSEGNFKWIIDHCWPLLENLDMENMEAILHRPIIDHDIEAILHRPMKSFPNGWKAGFKELLMQACGEYKNKYGEPLAPEIVLLTGGGSHMSFTGDVCREVFGSAIVNPDPQPFYTVARGLAEFGHWEYRVRQFHKAIVDFCDSPKLEKELQRQIDSLAKIVVKFFVGKPLIEGVYRPMLHELKKGTLNPSRIGDSKTYIYQRLAEWLKTPEGLQAQQEVINDFAKLLDPYIVPETDHICEEYGIPRGSLQLHVTSNPEIFIFKKYPKLGFSERLAYKEMDMFIYMVNRIIPVSARNLVPEKIVDLFMDFASVTAKMEAPLRAYFAKLSPDAKKQFINDIRMQIKEQLEERAQEVESLIN